MSASKEQQESTGAELDTELRDKQDASQAAAPFSPSWLNWLQFIGGMVSIIFLALIVPWAFVTYKTGIFSSFPKALGGCAAGWGIWLILSAIIGAVCHLIVMAIASFKRRNPKFIGYWMMTGYVIGHILKWTFITSLIGVFPCAIFFHDGGVIGEILGWAFLTSFIGMFLHVAIFPDCTR